MKVLLLGATGNLGSRILPALLAYKHNVIVYVRSEKKLRDVFPASILSSVSVVCGDAENANSIRDALVEHRCDGLINASGGIAFLPWQPYKHQGIVHAVADAAVEAAKTLGYPLRCWFIAGATALDIPGTKGTRIATYFPVLREHTVSYDYLCTKSLSEMKWSMFCPSTMLPASPEPDFSLRPRGNTLVAGIDVPGGNWSGKWLSSIPIVGTFIGVVVNGVKLNLDTKLEDCADLIAADLDDGLESKFIGHRVGPYDDPSGSKEGKKA